MTSIIGKNVNQKEGFEAFIPNPFTPKGIFDVSSNLLLEIGKADRLIGNLNGSTNNLPDVDFFLKMFVMKDAEASSQIEGTQASLIDALQVGSSRMSLEDSETDAWDIIYYIKALNYGIEHLEKIPLSLRFIRSVHKTLMTGAGSSHFADPGHFRKTQNWIGGTTPSNASFVPPPVDAMKKSLNDFEKFLHNNKDVLPLIHIGIMHAQFETIHPFLDGNGRTGRLLITFLLLQQKLLERPVLFLSSYFKRHQQVYYQRLNEYRYDGGVEKWLEFFLDGVIEIAQESIQVSRKISKLRDDDMAKIQSLAKRESESGVLVLSRLFSTPIVTNQMIMEWTGFSRPGAQGVINRLIEIDILKSQEDKWNQDKSYIYKRYTDIFIGDEG